MIKEFLRWNRSYVMWADYLAIAFVNAVLGAFIALFLWWNDAPVLMPVIIAALCGTLWGWASLARRQARQRWSA